MNQAPLTHILRGGIIAYRTVMSPWLGAQCRFEPSCSAYALEALSEYGAMRGSIFAFRRICRCHPWGGMGYDPVPTRLHPTSRPEICQNTYQKTCQKTCEASPSPPPSQPTGSS